MSENAINVIEYCDEKLNQHKKQILEKQLISSLIKKYSYSSKFVKQHYSQALVEFAKGIKIKFHQINKSHQVYKSNEKKKSVEFELEICCNYNNCKGSDCMHLKIKTKNIGNNKIINYCIINANKTKQKSDDIICSYQEENKLDEINFYEEAVADIIKRFHGYDPELLITIDKKLAILAFINAKNKLKLFLSDIIRTLRN